MATHKIVGRQPEINALKQTLTLRRHLVIEGPVGVGKTFLVTEALKSLGLNYQRVDGDTRYTEQKLTGWFDPPTVLKKGYTKDAFIEGPLVLAMKKGEVLFINELNRMPESVQNILLPAMDEGRIMIPKWGEVVAKSGFTVVATQNPKEFTATHALSEALLDRFEMLTLSYQTREEEINIATSSRKKKANQATIELVVDLVRSTRQHPAIKRGASIRAALSILDLIESGMPLKEACLMALPTRIEMLSADEDPRQVIENLLDGPTLPQLEKKKSQRR